MANKSKDINTPWGMLASIFIRAIDRAAVIPVTLCLIPMVILIRWPSEELPDLIYNTSKFLYGLFTKHEILGWGLFFLTNLLWCVYLYYVRMNTAKEFKRIGLEKSRLQKKLHKRNLPSSDDVRSR